MTDQLTQQREALEALDRIVIHGIDALCGDFRKIRTYILNSTQREERDQYRDMAQDYAAQLDAIRQALGVEVEPHQTLGERLMDAARESTALPEGWLAERTMSGGLHVRSPDGCVETYASPDSYAFLVRFVLSMLDAAPKRENSHE